MAYKILIVDDEKMMTELLSDHLRDCGYDTITANCSRQAVEMLPKQPDLIILDINLPDGNGFDFLKQLRKTSDVPVLVVTANDTELDEVTGLTLGADDYVTKPFSLMALRLRVNNLLSRALAGKPCDVQNRYEKDCVYFRFTVVGLQSELGSEIDQAGRPSQKNRGCCGGESLRTEGGGIEGCPNPFR